MTTHVGGSRGIPRSLKNSPPSWAACMGYSTFVPLICFPFNATLYGVCILIYQHHRRADTIEHISYINFVLVHQRSY